MWAVRWLLAIPLILFWIAGSAEAAGSPGCNLPPPASVPDHVMLEGRERSLIADIPVRYNASHPHRLAEWHKTSHFRETTPQNRRPTLPRGGSAC